MKLLYFPNPMLNTVCAPVTVFDETLKSIIEEMKVVMAAEKGIGLSGNQVGLDMRLFIVQDRKGNIHEFINPKIIETDGTSQMQEGCLSAPLIYLNLVRPANVLVEYQDSNGEVRKLMAEGIEARAIQHEYDHLNGKFYFEYVNRAARKIAMAQLKKVLK